MGKSFKNPGVPGFGITNETFKASEIIELSARNLANDFNPSEASPITWLVNCLVYFNATYNPKEKVSVNLDKYIGRTFKIDRQLLDDWKTAQDKIGLPHQRLTHIYFEILFNDHLWQGSEWKIGNPKQCLNRLSALPKEPVKKLVDSLGLEGMRMPHYSASSEVNDDFPEQSFQAADILISVDSLFVNGMFATELFDIALPKFMILRREYFTKLYMGK